MRAQHALPTSKGKHTVVGANAATGAGAPSTSGSSIASAPRGMLMATRPRARDRRGVAVGVITSVRIQTRQRRGGKAVIFRLLNVDGDRVADEWPAEASDTVRIGTVVYTTARRQEQLGKARDAIRVGRPGEQVKHRKITA